MIEPGELTKLIVDDLPEGQKTTSILTPRQEYMKRYYLAHREEHIARMRQYDRDHRETLTEYRRRYNRQYHKDNREARAEHDSQYYKEHPGVKQDAANRYKARSLGAEGTYTTEEFISLCRSMNWRCYYCNCILTQETVTRDHKVPLVRGGSNYIDNIAPACKACNQRKSTKTAEEFCAGDTK